MSEKLNLEAPTPGASKDIPEVESWRVIPGYEGFYEASNAGRVRSVDRTLANGKRRKGKILSPARGKLTEHQHVILCRNGKRKMQFVHRAVLESFVGPCPDGMEACHRDGVPTNNHLGNLRWGTPVSNMQDRLRHGNNPQSNKTHCPRSHPLELPNLTKTSVKHGWRKCLACQRTSRQIEYHGEGDFQELSDIHYRNIMEGN